MLCFVCVLTENTTRLSLQVSGDGLRVLVVAITGQVFLWECMSVKDLMGIRDGEVKGRWSHICALGDSLLPSAQDKEASQHTIFVKTKVFIFNYIFALHVFSPLGHVLYFTFFLFLSGYGGRLFISLCFHRWDKINHHLPENRLGGGSCEGGVSEQVLLCSSLSQRTVEMHVCLCRSEGYNIQWVTKTYSMSCLTPPCKPVRSRGALVPTFSPDGRLFAVVLNQRQPNVSTRLNSYA